MDKHDYKFYITNKGTYNITWTKNNTIIVEFISDYDSKENYKQYYSIREYVEFLQRAYFN